MRGLKHGVHEFDLFGVKVNPSGGEARYVAVQVSLSPIGYISPLLPEYNPSFVQSKTSTTVRPKKIIRPCVEAWVKKKFTSPDKVRVRQTKSAICES